MTGKKLRSTEMMIIWVYTMDLFSVFSYIRATSQILSDLKTFEMLVWCSKPLIYDQNRVFTVCEVKKIQQTVFRCSNNPFEHPSHNLRLSFRISCKKYPFRYPLITFIIYTLHVYFGHISAYVFLPFFTITTPFFNYISRLNPHVILSH